jgi:hypothetical protein
LECRNSVPASLVDRSDALLGILYAGGHSAAK